MTELTVLFSTRNGEYVLPRTLDGYVRQQDPGFEWKLIVVDNGSTDATADIVKRYRDKLRLEFLSETVPGKNRALNRALDSTEGEIVVLSDDDAIPGPGFLSAWRKAFNRQPESAVFGGSIVPYFEIPPPEWMSQTQFHFGELYSLRFNVPEGPVRWDGIYGPNMAVRRAVFVRGLKFSERIGPNGGDPGYAMGSETDFCARAHKLGYKMWFAPEPTVQHIVRPHQILPAYCAKRAYRFGRGSAQLRWEGGFLTKRPLLSRLVAPSWHLCKRAYLASRTIRLDERKKLEARWKYEFNRGFRDEYVRLVKAQTMSVES